MKKNLAQEEAIKTIDGQLLLISCPGSGKTTTLLRRIDYMMKSGINPENILMVTFTDAAAKEMKNRFIKHYGQCKVTFCTIHSLCYQVICIANRYKPEILKGYQQSEIFHNIYNKMNIPMEERPKFQDMSSDVSGFMNAGTSFEPRTFDMPTLQTFVKIYQADKEKINCIDFDDMLHQCRDIFNNNEEILNKFRNRFKYLMCDEYQDTNYIQRDILYKLAGKNGNLCVVGDDDQSIYGFRGAQPDIMLNFDKDYPNCKKIYMDTNYRSYSSIIESAKDLIDNNQKRYKKDIKSSHEEKGSIKYFTLDTDEQEHQKIINDIQELRKEYKLNEIAILTRTNAQLESFACLLESNHIPYHSSENIKSKYEHWIFEDILAYIRTANETGTFKDFLRILNKPNRYLRNKDFEDMEEITTKEIYNCAASSKSRIALDQAGRLITLLESLKEKPLYNQVQILANSAYGEYLDKLVETGEKEDKLLVMKMNDFVQEAKAFNDCDAWEVYAHQQITNMKNKQAEKNLDSVALLTMHKSKGLEWDIVLLPDCCDSMIPYVKKGATTNYEEERRLFYVAVTRAKKQVNIYKYKNRKSSKGNLTRVEPSIFLPELDGTKKKEQETRLFEIQKRHDEANSRLSPTNIADTSYRDLKKGDSVNDAILGEGTVIAKNAYFITIRFKTERKTFPL